MKYKVGQKVNVRKDLKVGLRYDGVLFAHGMEDGCGTSQPIVSITENGHYEVELNGLIWVLSDAMLEPISDEPTRPEPSRLEIAAMAMTGYIAHCKVVDENTHIYAAAFGAKSADALIKECNRTKVEDRP